MSLRVLAFEAGDAGTRGVRASVRAVCIRLC